MLQLKIVAVWGIAHCKFYTWNSSMAMHVFALVLQNSDLHSHTFLAGKDNIEVKKSGCACTTTGKTGVQVPGFLSTRTIPF